ncbi:MBL fold metallo-hydrolase [Ramlibacter sp. AW1]|uniref:MBL fold metallo-hydrolase n=1 Tax=Ramlibacter aurantiacus TaxID=2801330 RepID=A0A936ZF37_9BURK|nr:MBL fold metallo-hydrolase [Ramlibacter aurantiacus]MBL0418727.1 MBL fold metallo-hydrolase [Ramlibacter aurantiacus]
MSLVFQQLLTEAIGDASYLVGDDSAQVCAVIDPQVDVARYIDAAREQGLAIRYVIQTHTHEDFVSGACALAARVPGSQLCVSGHAQGDYGFEHRPLRDQDELVLGSVRLRVRHTPGHTPEHIALVLSKSGDEPPFAVLSGGALLVGAAGRTDLLGPEQVDELTRQQFESLRRVFMQLPDGVLVYPTHVHGSPCGAAIGDRPTSSIAQEKASNEHLRQPDEASFRRVALSGLPPKPSYYPRLKDTNTAGPEVAVPQPVAALPPREFAKAAESPDVVVIDTRQMLAFGGGHVPKALNFGAAGHLAIQAGWMLDPGRPLLLVLEKDAQLEAVLAELARTGLTRVAGYLAGGMSAWQNEGLALQALQQLHVRDLAQVIERGTHPLTVVDVRAPHEWQEGHVPGATHIFLPELPDALPRLDKHAPVAVYCDSGYRASIAASLLQAQGYDVRNVPGSWQAWRACGLPVASD